MAFSATEKPGAKLLPHLLSGTHYSHLGNPRGSRQVCPKLHYHKVIKKTDSFWGGMESRKGLSSWTKYIPSMVHPILMPSSDAISPMIYSPGASAFASKIASYSLLLGSPAPAYCASPKIELDKTDSHILGRASLSEPFSPHDT